MLYVFKQCVKIQALSSPAQYLLTENLHHFHVYRVYHVYHTLSGYPPDLLHNLFQGIIHLELTLCLAVFINKKYLTLSETNDAIKSFPFKWSDKINCPKSVALTFATWKSVGGNAHENWALIRFLQFLI